MVVDNLIFDHVISGTFYGKSDNEAKFRLNQIQNPSLSNTGETVDIMSNTGVMIAQLDRNKGATFSGENALKNMQLFAAQAGTELEEASAIAPIVVPAYDIIDTVAGTTEYALSHTPIDGSFDGVYVLTAGGALGKKLTMDTSAGKDKFAYSEGKVTVAFGAEGTCEAGESLIFMYDYEEQAKAVQFVNYADQFSKPMRAVFEVIAHEACAMDQKVYVLLEFPNVKLSSTFDLDMNPDAAQPFELQCMVDYCAKEKDKKLYRIVVVDGE